MKDRYLSLIVIGFGALLLCGLGLWVDYDLKEYEKNTWYQTGVVMEKYEGWQYVDVIIEVEEGKRYTINCSICLLGDTVTLQMQKEKIVKITNSITTRENKK